MRATQGIWVLVVLAAMGCQSGTSDSSSSQSAPPADTPIATPATRIGGLELSPLETQAAPVASGAAPSPQPPSPEPTVPAPSPPRTEQVKADVGVGVRGKSLQEHRSLLVEPAKAYFRTAERVVFQIQIPQAMNLFKAMEGRAPRSHDEFMSRIIKENQIRLPPLSAGEKYVYDPATSELMVERPAQ